MLRARAAGQQAIGTPRVWTPAVRARSPANRSMHPVAHSPRSGQSGLASASEGLYASLSAMSMEAAQRVRWLAAALVAAPDSSTDRLDEFVRGRERRVRALAAFFGSGDSIAAAVTELRGAR